MPGHIDRMEDDPTKHEKPKKCLEDPNPIYTHSNTIGALQLWGETLEYAEENGFALNNLTQESFAKMVRR